MYVVGKLAQMLEKMENNRAVNQIKQVVVINFVFL